ncbi:unnamed protein product [Owenia fusiformis]|uniref:RRM domain-containing protein n=1 Tax=Owenia fusiformis TaxID=6347 RepID=A0A8S4PEH4_OWEFU|nr:unnamed protein product [Owenia fusiformis]
MSCLTVDSKGYYSVSFPKPSPTCTKQEVQGLFGLFGKIAECKCANKTVTISFETELAARKAIHTLGDKFNIEAQSSRPDLEEETENTDSMETEIYIGNIPAQLSKEELTMMLQDYHLIQLRMFNKNTKRFAFAKFIGLHEACQAVIAFHNKVVYGREIVLRLVCDKPESEEESSIVESVEENAADGDVGENQYKDLPMEGNGPYPQLFIGNIPLNYNLEQIKRELNTSYPNTIGQIVLKNADHNKNKMAFVEVRNKKVGDGIIADLNASMIQEHRVIVTWSKASVSQFNHNPLKLQVHIGNIPSSLKKDDIKKLVEEFGPVSNISLKKDVDFNFSFVDVDTELIARNIIAGLNHKSVQGRQLRADFSAKGHQLLRKLGTHVHDEQDSLHSTESGGKDQDVTNSLDTSLSKQSVKNILPNSSHVSIDSRQPSAPETSRSKLLRSILTNSKHDTQNEQCQAKVANPRAMKMETPVEQNGLLDSEAAIENASDHGGHHQHNWKSHQNISDIQQVLGSTVPMQSKCKTAVQLCQRAQVFMSEALDDCPFCQKTNQLMNDLLLLLQDMNEQAHSDRVANNT